MGGGAMNPAAAAAGGGGGGALSVGLAYAAPVAAAGGEGDELCIEEPVEVSRPGGPEEEEEDSRPPPPPRPLGSSRGVLRRFFHLARRFWNQT